MQDSVGSFQYFNGVRKALQPTTSEVGHVLKREEQIFENAYNEMQTLFKEFKSYDNTEKVFNIQQMMPQFIHTYEKAKQAMDAINRSIGEKKVLMDDK